MSSHSEQEKKELQQFLKQAIAPADNLELRRDLWPQMLSKLNENPAPVPWFDWVLVGVLGASLLIFPGAIPALFYHL